MGPFGIGPTLMATVVVIKTMYIVRNCTFFLK